MAIYFKTQQILQLMYITLMYDNNQFSMIMLDNCGNAVGLPDSSIVCCGSTISAPTQGGAAQRLPSAVHWHCYILWYTQYYVIDVLYSSCCFVWNGMLFLV